jgi:hypothetical protein
MRPSPDERRLRIEHEQLNLAINQSLSTIKDYEATKSFKNFNEFISCLNTNKISGNFTMMREEDSVSFLIIKTKPVPFVLSSAVVDKNLKLRFFF